MFFILLWPIHLWVMYLLGLTYVSVDHHATIEALSSIDTPSNLFFLRDKVNCDAPGA
jgi:hypothetical protein